MARDIEPTWDPRKAVSGGELLRRLRNDAGLSLMELAGRMNDAGVRTDGAHLYKIETGQIRRPAFETVDAILTAGLDAAYRTRRNVLNAFGYRLPWALPTEDEIEEARRLFDQELTVTTWPAYLMDHGHRLWAWNRYGPKLLGVRGDDVMQRYIGVTTLDTIFNPELGLNLRIANPDVYRELFLRSFKIQTQPYADEPWHKALIERARRWPGFTAVWDALPDDADDMMMTRSNHPIEFHVPGYDAPLRFRIVLVYLSLDPRFQVISWIPFGAATMRICADWAEQFGEV